MTRVVRGVLEAPTVLRLDEAVELPLNVPVEVAISEPAPEPGAPAGHVPESAFTALALTLGTDGPTDLPADYSERWREYLADEERERNR